MSACGKRRCSGSPSSGGARFAAGDAALKDESGLVRSAAARAVAAAGDVGATTVLVRGWSRKKTKGYCCVAEAIGQLGAKEALKSWRNSPSLAESRAARRSCGLRNRRLGAADRVEAKALLESTHEIRSPRGTGAEASLR